MDGVDATERGFWDSPAPADDVAVAMPRSTDGGEPPALRTLQRPPSWRAASSPASALSALYTSAQRRAEEVLRSALGDEDDLPVDEDAMSAAGS